MENTEKIEKRKNIVFIIGNGFDLNLGLKTSYYDFVKWYTKIDSNDNQPVQFLKDHIDIEDFKWGDLELKLGEYTSLYDNYEEFYKAYCDMGEKLMLYLSLEENKYFQLMDTQKRAIAHSLIDDILIFFTKNNLFSNDDIEIDIVTFNYTAILDEIVNLINERDDLKEILQRKKVNIHLPIHCHGILNRRKICFGVDNYSQIINQKIFEKHSRFIEQMIKPKRNKAINEKNMLEAEKIIKNSDVIVIYGCSFGETDYSWLKKIKQRMGATIYYNVFDGERIEFEETNIKDDIILINYSYKKIPKSTFDADFFEFRDIIREKYAFKDDKRVIVSDINIFETIRNKIN